MNVDIPYLLNVLPSYDELLDTYCDPQVAYVAHKVCERVYKRTRLAEAQNWRCCWCGCETVPMPKKRNSATIEHLLPKSLGGTNDMDNLAMACAHCNSKRSSLDMAVFMQIISNKNQQRKAA